MGDEVERGLLSQLLHPGDLRGRRGTIVTFLHNNSLILGVAIWGWGWILWPNKGTHTSLVGIFSCVKVQSL